MMKADCTVTVIIPTYNRARQVTKAVESALDQTFRDREIIVVDDGSTDDTAYILSEYRNLIRYIRVPNSGPAAARNRGIDLARGRYTAFLDSDDTWRPDKLKAQMDAIERFASVSAVCFTDAKAVGRPLSEASLFEAAQFRVRHDIDLVEDTLGMTLARRSPVLLTTLMASQPLLKELGGFDEALTVYEDADLIFRLALRTRFCCVNRPLTLYNALPLTESAPARATRYDPVARIAAEKRLYSRLLAEIGDRCPSARREVRRRLAGVLGAEAAEFLSRGDVLGARRSMADAARVRMSAGMLSRLFLVNFFPKLLLRQREAG